MLANLHKVSHLQEFVNARYTLKKANGGGKRDESVVYDKKKKTVPSCQTEQRNKHKFFIRNQVSGKINTM